MIINVMMNPLIVIILIQLTKNIRNAMKVAMNVILEEI